MIELRRVELALLVDRGRKKLRMNVIVDGLPVRGWLKPIPKEVMP